MNKNLRIKEIIEYNDSDDDFLTKLDKARTKVYKKIIDWDYYLDGNFKVRDGCKK